jgi:hypothetical protein
MRLYDAGELGQVPWPDTAEGRFARAYLTPLLRQGSEAFVSDRTALRLLAFDGMVVPLAVNDAEYDNTPLLSNYARYVRVPLGSLAAGVAETVGGRARVRLSWAALAGMGAALKAAGVDRCVYVDHWLALRNMGAMLSDEQAGRLTRFLVERFPDHAVVFSALSLATYAPLLGVLRGRGYDLVYAFHTRLLLPEAAVSRAVRENRRRDARALEAAGYRVVDGRELPGCAPRLAELYRSLNEEKYGAGLGVSAAFFEAALRDETLRFRLAVRDGRVDGFFAYALGHDVLFAPAFGYDVGLPQELGLYRGLVHRLMQEAIDLGVAVELGAGADRFKRLRGDRPVPRYSAVYARHLPGFRRVGFRLLERLANGPLRAASRAQIRAVDGDDAVGFDGAPSAYAALGASPSEAAASLRRELDALEAALGRAAGLEGEALARALAPLAERLHNWAQPPRRAVELREELARLERHARRAARGGRGRARGGEALLQGPRWRGVLAALARPRRPTREP